MTARRRRASPPTQCAVAARRGGASPGGRRLRPTVTARARPTSPSIDRTRVGRSRPRSADPGRGRHRARRAPARCPGRDVPTPYRPPRARSSRAHLGPSPGDPARAIPTRATSSSTSSRPGPRSRGRRRGAALHRDGPGQLRRRDRRVVRVLRQLGDRRLLHWSPSAPTTRARPDPARRSRRSGLGTRSAARADTGGAPPRRLRPVSGAPMHEPGRA